VYQCLCCGRNVSNKAHLKPIFRRGDGQPAAAEACAVCGRKSRLVWTRVWSIRDKARLEDYVAHPHQVCLDCRRGHARRFLVAALTISAIQFLLIAVPYFVLPARAQVGILGANMVVRPVLAFFLVGTALSVLYTLVFGLAGLFDDRFEPGLLRSALSRDPKLKGQLILTYHPSLLSGWPNSWIMASDWFRPSVAGAASLFRTLSNGIRRVLFILLLPFLMAAIFVAFGAGFFVFGPGMALTLPLALAVVFMAIVGLSTPALFTGLLFGAFRILPVAHTMLPGDVSPISSAERALGLEAEDQA
jgi:hypothetical protein